LAAGARVRIYLSFYGTAAVETYEREMFEPPVPPHGNPREGRKSLRHRTPARRCGPFQPH
jgi:hypothetical protein